MPDKNTLPPIYPCLFPVKIIGECSAEFEADVLSVMKRYVEDLSEDKIGRTLSGGGKYLSLTIHIIAKNREHLEELYAEPHAREKVIMVI